MLFRSTRMTLQVNGAPPADTNVVRRVIRGGERLSFVLRSNTRYQFTASHTGTYRIRVLSVSRLNGGRLVVRGAESVSFVRQPQLLSGSRDILFVGGRISSAGNLASVDNALQVDLLVVGPGQTELPVAAVFSIEPPD